MAPLAQSQNPFSSANEQEEAFRGTLVFRARTISFLGTTILIKNVAKFEEYGLKHIHKIPIFLILISLVFAISGLYAAPYGLAATLLFGYIAFLGIKERLRKDLYGLTIELNSGTKHNFLSKDRQGIGKLLIAITEAVENDEPINQVFYFEGDKVKGDKYEFNNSTIENAGRTL